MCSETPNVGVTHDFQPLQATWKPSAAWIKQLNPQVTINLQPSVSFNPSFTIDTTIEAGILTGVKLSYSATLSFELVATVTATAQTSYSGVASDVYLCLNTKLISLMSAKVFPHV